MRTADAETIAAGTSEATLVQRAGLAVARAAISMLGGTYGRHVVVVSGTGNNGADGAVAARELRRRGLRVACFELGDDFDRAPVGRALRHADLFVDAMFGTGLARALSGDAAWVASQSRNVGLVLAVDIPSGVDGATGVILGADPGDDVAVGAVRADRTITFAALKPGLLFEPGRSHAGVVEVADIGIDPARGAIPDGPIDAVEDGDVHAWLPPRAADAHKWSAGGVMVIGGHDGMTGAPLLSGHAALRAGAGIVFVGLPGVDAARAASGTELITRTLPADAGGALAAAAAATVIEAAPRFGCLVLGPGLGAGEGVRAVIARAVAEVSVPIVIDADGLNALAQDHSPWRVRAAAARPPAVLTPHAGEYARLAGHPVGADRIAAARELARDTAAIVVLKGPGTVIAAPSGRVLIATSGSQALATAGSGDVLSGIIAAFVARTAGSARPFDAAFEAVAAAVQVHGRTAEISPTVGLIAGDLIERVPRVLAR
jgi:hydroxyethylthiazole kinase-like uncharacterized protein yjeF